MGKRGVCGVRGVGTWRAVGNKIHAAYRIVDAAYNFSHPMQCTRCLWSTVVYTSTPSRDGVYRTYRTIGTHRGGHEA
jgi:hypothetical protein